MDRTEPSRSDLYAAQIAAEVRRANPGCKDPNKVKVSDFILEQRKSTESQAEPATTEDRAAQSKAAWALFLTPHGQTKKKPKTK